MHSTRFVFQAREQLDDLEGAVKDHKQILHLEPKHAESAGAVRRIGGILKARAAENAVGTYESVHRPLRPTAITICLGPLPTAVPPMGLPPSLTVPHTRRAL